MKAMRLSVTLLCVLALTAAAWAQPAAAPPAEPVLQHVPAGALAYLVVNNAKATTDRVDKFLQDTGLAEIIFHGQPTPVLEFIKSAAKLGEGFNSSGGAAFVVLDPKPFNVDLIGAFTGKHAAAPVEGEPATQPAKEDKPPIVIFLAASSIEGLFSNYKMAPSGKYTLVKFRSGDAYAAQVGPYVAFSPEERYLDAALSAAAKAPSELAAYDADVMAKADLAFRVNVPVAMPLLEAAIGKLESKLGVESSAGEGKKNPLKMILGFYVGILRQADAFTVAAQVADDGVVVNALVTFQPTSEMGKMMALLQGGSPAALVNRLPDLPYVLAVGAGAKTAEGKKAPMDAEVLNKLLQAVPEDVLSAEMKARVKKLSMDMAAQVDGVQYVVGGAPADSGLLGVAGVIQCKDADAVKASLADGAGIAQDLLNKFFASKHTEPILDDSGNITGSKEVESKFSIHYEKNVADLGGVSLDAIVIDHPTLAKMKESGAGQLSMFLGEDTIRLLVAAPDKNTVVVTFGGATPLMAEALKVAKGGGPIASAPETQAALKHMPQDAIAVVLLNGGNAFVLADRFLQAFAPGQELPFRINAKTPIALGAGAKGNTAHLTLFVPKDLVTDGVAAYKKMTAPPQETTTQQAPPKGAQDF